VKSRLQHPGWWSAAIALAMFPCLFSSLLPSPHTRPFFLGLAWAIPVLNVGLFLCPTPWQWTGDDRPLAGWWRGLLQLAAFALFMGVLMAPLGWLTGKESPRDAFRRGEIFGLSVPFLIMLGPAGWIIARAEHLAQETREAQLRARETQWMSHRGAFSPRLLFSNLSHLATVAAETPHSAEQGLVDLATLYRRWLVEAELPLVPLSTDRSLTEQYLALERSRWGDRFKLRWHLDSELDHFQVPPLFLQPLLEMILEPDPTERLEVDLHEGLSPQGRLELRVRVQGAASLPDEPLLQSLRQRLQATLGREAEVSVATLATAWEASLNLPAMKTEARS
jgi:hypothetical protein